MIIANKWKNFTSPARPSISELEIFERYIAEVAKRPNSRILVMGSTPEFRDLTMKYGCKATVVDFSEDIYRALTLLLKEKGEEEFIHSDWLQMPENQKYDLVLGDGVPNMLPWEKWDSLLGKIAAVLKPDGISVQRVYSSYTIVNEEALLDKIREWRVSKPPATFINWAMWSIMLNDVLKHGMFDYPRSAEYLKGLLERGLITQQEFTEWERLSNPIKICVPRRFDADIEISKHLSIRGIFFGTEPHLGNIGPIYVCGRREPR